jgi:hypothetical protein
MNSCQRVQDKLMVEAQTGMKYAACKLIKMGKGHYDVESSLAHWLYCGASRNRFKRICREKTTYGITFPTTNHF